MEIHRISCQNIDKTDCKIGGKYYKVEQSLARRISDESMTTVIRVCTEAFGNNGCILIKLMYSTGISLG